MSYEELSEEKKNEIGEQMIKNVIGPLSEIVESTLSPEFSEEIKKVVLELHSNLGTIVEKEFDNVEDAMDFLDDVDVSVFEVLDAVKLTDNPHSEKHLQ